MSCESCKASLSEETKAVRAASDMGQKYTFLCRAVIALVIGFVVMAGCMVYAVTNAQRIANEAANEAIRASQETMNEAVLAALETMAEMEVAVETTTTITQDTGEGSGNNVYQAGEQATYNEAGDLE